MMTNMETIKIDDPRLDESFAFHVSIEKRRCSCTERSKLVARAKSTTAFTLASFRSMLPEIFIRAV